MDRALQERSRGAVRLVAASLMLITVICADRARADQAPQPRGPFAISAGAAFPTSSNALYPSSSNTQAAFGLEYSFAIQPSGMAFTYLDLRHAGLYYQNESVGALGFGYSTESVDRERPYAGLALGYSYATIGVSGCGNCVPLPPHCIDFCGPTATSGNSSAVGGKVFAGLDLAGGLGFEAAYELSPIVNGVNTNAIDVRLKYRFK